MPVQTAEFALADEDATTRLGAALARAVERHAVAITRHGLIIALGGELGTGKTSLVRAMLRALGITGAVRSPTFTLVEPYVVSSLNFYHFDFYRLADPEEFSFAGFREMFGPGAVCLVEWPERAAGYLPPADLTIALRTAGAGRQASVTAAGEFGTACLDRIMAEMAARGA
ncbi:MAG: tRNA (adenosine(37)-N6)-threonylcarbamoyltransferase complex ATPase subunit type 1 TsaE [Burkholderiaceae bacterium]|jgi:tRNA threonylcarbamoyladenosine biosynthesis protein TsaE|nr:tRNA (adenosine(37)-N6)-threonylcarbamoyltransferase complex ATPase subunit type 1 TsaE [Burkholderiaceae bacterium]